MQVGWDKIGDFRQITGYIFIKNVMLDNCLLVAKQAQMSEKQLTFNNSLV